MTQENTQQQSVTVVAAGDSFVKSAENTDNNQNPTDNNKSPQNVFIQMKGINFISYYIV